MPFVSLNIVPDAVWLDVRSPDTPAVKTGSLNRSDTALGRNSPESGDRGAAFGDSGVRGCCMLGVSGVGWFGRHAATVGLRRVLRAAPGVQKGA